ncbi:MAG: aspartate aminotransferase family protein [Rhodospirillum sp.]|nr:aspartate aminotransferase family protein [Rhodospirillum sp.]MCF8488768.1 aspartate aminotransferase family protein [Rhodospirillum sp.]MCF8499720.1 aspartate aminotransferase family protein [Rhodospirillum sp.]
MTISAVMPTYSRVNISFERGEGAWLLANDGRRYLDFGGGVAVTSLGHAHPHLVEALRDQAGKLWHCSNLYEIPGQHKLAQRLVENTFADSVFFCNSGAEAMEGSLKLARRYQQVVKGQPQRNRIIVATEAFHGRTLATLAAGGSETYRQGFGPMPDGFDRVAFGNLNEARAAVTDETAAILVEPIQGEGGINPPPEGYLAGLRKMADEFGLVLIMDEIQTGMGRTGKLFAHQWEEGAEPDVMAVAKGIGGGFPMGAFLAREDVAQALTPGTHGSTFGGNPLAMAVGNAVFDVMLADGFLEGVQSAAKDLWTRLEGLVAGHPTVLKAVRGKGLMIGLVCVVSNTQVLDALRAEGLLAVPAGGNVVRLLPPLIIGKAEIDAAEVAIEAACARIEKGEG